jgi:hypothetical protein
MAGVVIHIAATEQGAHLGCFCLLLFALTSILPGLGGSGNKGSGARGGVEDEVLPDRQVLEEYVCLMNKAC